MACEALGIPEDDPRPLTVTGGLPYFGGAGNNYSSHAIAAMGKILNNQAGLADASFELGAIAVLTAVFFGAGSWMFTRRHLRPQ